MAGRRAGWWIAGAILLVVTVVGIWIVSVLAHAQSELDRHKREVAEGIETLPPPPNRPVLIGEPVEGNAWDFYEPALKPLKEACTEEIWEQIQSLRDRHRESVDTPVMEARAMEVLTQARKSVDALKEGLRRTRVDPGFSVEDGFSPYQLRIRIAELGLRVVNALITQDRLEGKDDSALELATVVMAVARDFHFGGSLEGAHYGVYAEANALDECRKIFERGKPSIGVLKMLAERLARLEDPRTNFRELWRNEDLVSRSGLLWSEKFVNPFDQEPIRPGWRSMFSSKLMKVETLALIRDGYQRLMDASSKSLREQKAEAYRIESEIQDHPNPIVWLWVDFDSHTSKVYTVPWHLKQELENQAHRTIFRTVVALALYEADERKAAGRLGDLVPRYLPGVPECPYTGRPLGYAPGRVWSAGLNEKDDGGVSPEPANGQEWEIYTGGDKDIVWRIDGRK